ncbi:YybH family protein [Nonomuraea sp. NPDC059194]|uniref:YybH family protein n=1 Tax=Nonomuraea sp. NPDC059194 TaxID=3346764 RepID=UPI0036ACD771
MTDLVSWMDAYVRAWHTNDPADIGALFAEDAAYYTEPYAQPWRGRDTIVKEWLARKDDDGPSAFEYEPVAITPDVAVVKGVTTYPDTAFSNLWLITLDADGRCAEFVEYWMEHRS